MLTPEEVKNLLKKYNAGSASEKEKALLEQWYVQWNQDAPPPEVDDIEVAKNQIWMRLLAGKDKLTRVYRFIPYAAALLCIVALSVWLVRQPRQWQDTTIASKKDPVIQPGGNQATLMLADGSTINLGELPAGQMVRRSGIRISKNGESELVYHTDPGFTGKEHLFNTISTPVGGQFQVTLPDGSKVWLNAESVLRYPTRFATNRREVELQGEAYFEIKKQDKPFIVLSNEQKVEVLGTHFNINAYRDEPAIITTLLEGSVRVTSSNAQGSTSRLLKPGQQSVLQSEGITVRAVNPEHYIGWKNDLIVFESQNLGNIMRQVARWYNVEVVFEDDIAQKKFSGSISKYENVGQVLDMLALTGLVHFKIEGRRVIVMK